MRAACVLYCFRHPHSQCMVACAGAGRCRLPPAPLPPTSLAPGTHRETIGAPGMVVLQFAWGGGPNNVHLPHMHYENCFCYPGTHDNETSVGWFKGSANAQDKVRARARMGVWWGGGGLAVGVDGGWQQRSTPPPVCWKACPPPPRAGVHQAVPAVGRQRHRLGLYPRRHAVGGQDEHHHDAGGRELGGGTRTWSGPAPWSRTAPHPPPRIGPAAAPTRPAKG